MLSDTFYETNQIREVWINHGLKYGGGNEGGFGNWSDLRMKSQYDKSAAKGSDGSSLPWVPVMPDRNVTDEETWPVWHGITAQCRPSSAQPPAQYLHI